MKTIQNWFNDLPETTKQNAMINAGAFNLNTTASNIRDAINKAFDIKKSNEGECYWSHAISEFNKKK